MTRRDSPKMLSRHINMSTNLCTVSLVSYTHFLSYVMCGHKVAASVVVI